jgi:SAM-dependent methyltransferase
VAPTGDLQERANERLWRRRNLVRKYAHEELRPSEARVLRDFAAELSGRALELGCGAGRVTGYMAALSDQVVAIDISPAMVEFARGAHPAVRFEVGDIRDLSAHASGSFDVIAAWCNVIDILGHAARGRFQDEARRLLAPGGVLVLCTHNIANRNSIRTPLDVRRDSLRGLAVDLARLPRAVYHRQRLRPHERVEDGYAILNDVSHDYMALHYYVARAEQERQLAERGFAVLACIASDGSTLAVDDPAPNSPDLHFVARV